MESKARILVIDDHERMVKVIQRILEKQGFDVLTALNGWTGLRKAREDKPDLIILDIIMPIMDGYEVCRRLQRDPDTARIPVLMLTAMGRTDSTVTKRRPRLLEQRVEQQLGAFDAGAVEFLTKPIGAKELVKRVRGLLWMSGAQSR